MTTSLAIGNTMARLGGYRFSPAALFSAGEQGAWYDPSDYNTLFTDSAGTTPVTGVEQFVGLMLDKSKGLVLGPELVDTFTLGTGWTYVNDVLVCDGSATNQIAAETTSAVIGNWYVVTFQVTRTSGLLQVRSGNVFLATLSASGTYTYRIAATGAVSVLSFTATSPAFVGSIDNISVRELPGNHAFQTSSAKRPKLAARYNLLTYSEEFDNGYWSIFAVSRLANTVLAPNLTLTADTLTASAGSGVHLIQQNNVISISANTSYTYSVSVKKNTYDFVTLSVNAGTTEWFAATVDFSTTPATISKTGAGAGGSYTSSSIVDSGNGWYRVTVTGSLGALTSARTNVSISPSANPTYGSNAYVTWTAAGTESIYIWGADLRPASQATGLIGPTYQRVAAATVYDTAGFLPYLAFDGLDDSMSTNSIDFSAVTSDGQARRNLLSVPTLFNSSPWVATNVTLASGVADAFGGNNAWTLTASAANGTVSQGVGSLAAGSTISCYIRRRTGTGAVALWVGNTYSNITVTSSWQRVEIQQAAITAGYFDIRLSTSGDAVDVMYPQVETGSPATAFQNIGTDKMTVWAGVRKLSDAAAGVVAEFSADTNSNNGTFAVIPSSLNTTRQTYEWRSKGTNLIIVTPQGFIAPTTNVLTGIGDISGDVCTLRVDGVQAATNTGNQGTGNFGNHPLYIGMRNNASLPFNGWLTSLIIRGAQSTQSQIEATEAWVNGKTGAY